MNLLSLSVSWLAFILCFVCPESPKWLLNNKLKTEAIEALNYIAWFNGIPNRIPTSAILIEDPSIFVNAEDDRS